MARRVKSRESRKVKQAFLSPLQIQRGENNRVNSVIFWQLEFGNPPIALSYPTVDIARLARLDMLKATNMHAVPNNALWEAIEKAINELMVPELTI